MHKWRQLFLQTCWDWGKAQLLKRYKDSQTCSMNDDVQDFDARWDQGYYQQATCHQMWHWKDCTGSDVQQKIKETEKNQLRNYRSHHDSYPRNLFYVNLENWDRNTPSNAPEAPSKNSGKKESIARNYPKVCASWAWTLRAKIRGKIARGDLAPRKMRPQSCMGSEKHNKLKNSDRTPFCPVIEAHVMPPFISKSPEKCEFVVDSGASMYVMSKIDCSSKAVDTLRRSRNPTVVLTANGEVHTNEEAQVLVHDLILFVILQLLEETPAVPSLCEDHRYSYVWVSGQKPRLTKDGKTFMCKTNNFGNP